MSTIMDLALCHSSLHTTVFSSHRSLEITLPHVSTPSVSRVLLIEKRPQALINLLMPICKGQVSDTIELTEGGKTRNR